MTMKIAIVLSGVVLLLVGCGPNSKVDRYTDNAIRACGGPGKVASIDVENGRYECKK